MPLRDWVTKDFGWKLFSLFLAIAIWLTVHKLYEETAVAGTPVVETTYRNLPVMVISASGDVHTYRVDPDTVSVTVKGPANVMEVLQARQIHVSADLTDLESAAGHRPLEVSVPAGVTFVTIDPQSVEVLEPLAREKKP